MKTVEQLRSEAGGCSPGSKPTNPKDVIGSAKVPLHLCMGPARIYWALGQLEGALKYGKVNWRTAGVRASIYIDAMERHLQKLVEGEWCDPATRVPHLGSIMACAAILIDAHEAGKLIDDRPKSSEGFSRLLDEWGVEMVAHLKQLFADKDPHHHLIKETEPVGEDRFVQ